MSLTEIKGIGPKINELLTKHNFTLENIQTITFDQLQEMDFSEKTANKLLEDIKVFFDTKKIDNISEETSTDESLIEKNEEDDDSIKETSEKKEISKKPIKMSRYRIKKKLKRKFKDVDNTTIRKFLRTEANNYDNLEDMIEAFKSYIK